MIGFKSKVIVSIVVFFNVFFWHFGLKSILASNIRPNWNSADALKNVGIYNIIKQV